MASHPPRVLFYRERLMPLIDAPLAETATHRERERHEESCKALLSAVELLTQWEQELEKREFQMVAAQLERDTMRPRPLDGEPLLASSAVRRVIAGRTRNGAGTGKNKRGVGKKEQKPA